MKIAFGFFSIIGQIPTKVRKATWEPWGRAVLGQFEPMLAEPWSDLRLIKDLKQRISIKQVLRRYNLFDTLHVERKERSPFTRILKLPSSASRFSYNRVTLKTAQGIQYHILHSLRQEPSMAMLRYFAAALALISSRSAELWSLRVRRGDLVPRGDEDARRAAWSTRRSEAEVCQGVSYESGYPHARSMAMYHRGNETGQVVYRGG
jgi:hypothetical protein